MVGVNPVEMSPMFSDGNLPLKIQPSLENADLFSWASNHKALILEKLYHHGAILFRGFQISTPEKMAAFIEIISGGTLAYQERSTPRTSIAGNIYTATDYPASQRIFPHNENSYQSQWPMKLFFQCIIPPEQGGETPLIDTRKVYQRIKPEIRQAFLDRDFLIVRNFNEEMGLNWPHVFGTRDRRSVEAYCQARDITVEWKPKGGLRTRTRRPAVRIHPMSGASCWFNHGTFFHVTTLDPSIAETIRRTVPEENLPSQTYYGDGSPIEADVIQHLRDCYEREMVMFPWQRGDLLMVDNMLTAHARTPFKGERKVLVAMADPHGPAISQESLL